MRRAGGLDRVADVLSDLGEDMEPERLVEASESAPILWAQRLGILLEHFGSGEEVVLLKEHVRQRAQNFTRLFPGKSVINAHRSKDRRLFVNSAVEVDA